MKTPFCRSLRLYLRLGIQISNVNNMLVMVNRNAGGDRNNLFPTHEKPNRVGVSSNAPGLRLPTGTMRSRFCNMARSLTSSNSLPNVLIPPFLLPCLHTQRRSASILSNLRDLPGAFGTKKRLGRGPSSGKGKTSGRGHKGQKQHGKVPRGFNGGQTKDEVVHGSRGFVNKYVFYF